MSDIAIRVEHLGKKYKLGGRQSGNLTFRESMIETVKAPLRWMRGERKPEQTSFWALDDVSFDIQAGEAVGIIGRNGAGKSTLLKVLSRITKPTRGRVDIYGRVGSLLEVGTGFHSELSGRENIFLNGAFLGMTRMEILSKFDEIVDFSGVEKFLDTPVKFYSSGMYVRLAFAVAAHLEPEILVVDEVLAVGDAEFQRKCLDKMGDVAHQGRTVLFVSHNMGAIAQLCNSAIVLQGGQIVFKGTTHEAVSIYLDKYRTHISHLQRDKSTLKNENQFVTIFNADSANQIQNEFRHDDEIKVIFEVYLPKWDDKLEVGLFPCDKFGRRIFAIDIPLKNYYTGNPFIKFAVVIPPQFLVVGSYSWMIFIHDPRITLYDYQESVCKFSILETGSVFSRHIGLDIGIVYPPKYSIETI
jgi:lipopolysaccharide transport system ATP-binding protein